MKPAQKRLAFFFTSVLYSSALGAIYLVARPHSSAEQPWQNSPPAYLGFDRNEYPGDAYLPALKQSFAFAGFWLNAPPGARSNSWEKKRTILRQAGFGFLVLFNGRSARQLKFPADAGALAAADAHDAAQNAQREGFSEGTIIFLDQEEGGRLLPAQRKYLLDWADGVASAGFGAGVYCSGIPVTEERNQSITTAEDIHDHEGSRRISFFVYNDVCPPSPGCAYSRNPPLPSTSGIPYADVWQFAQSPQRKGFAQACPANHYGDGNCYPAAGNSADKIYVDLDSATSADPSAGRR